MHGKDKKNKGQPALVDEDKEIMRVSKNKKRRERRERNTEKDDFDNILEKYQGALEKRFKQTDDGPAFAAESD
jgi:Holliday junction resolvase RusA-like endonuclease